MNKKLAKEIFKMVKIDQDFRKKFVAGKIKKWDEHIDRKHTKRLKEIVKRHGWPTVSRVGRNASGGAWLIVQHAVHDRWFQKKALALMKKAYAMNKKDIIPKNIAYLIDRIRIYEKKPQLFGTQFRKNKKGKFEPFPIRDKKNVNKRRKKYGMPTFAENQRLIKKW